MPELSQKTKELINQYQKWYNISQSKKETGCIHVDEIASKVASFYEKIRTIVDWKEEHLMRRAAIIRKLKRKFLNINLNNYTEENKIAESLILELIRGGHFPNDKIEESKIAEIQKIIDKYLFIIKNSPPAKTPREKLQFYDWIIGIASCEIEETLSFPIREKALINFMFQSMKERIKIQSGTGPWKNITEEEKNIQIYIAVQQALFKLDSPIISYNLLKYKFPEFKNQNEASGNLYDISKNIYKIWEEIEKSLHRPLGEKIYAICEKYDTPYLILGDILSKGIPKETAEKISNPEILEALAAKAYKKRLITLKSRLFRAAIYSTLSIFLTNSVSLLVLEIPLAKLITGRFMPITILVDILGPTTLMLLLISTIKPPSANNLNLVVMELIKIVYGKKDAYYEIKPPRKKGIFIKTLISVLYLLGACVSLGIIIKIFKIVKFPPTSIVINIIFIALIAFTGLAIRKRGEELTIEERKSGLLAFIFDILFLPIARLGRWLSNKWKKYNAIATFFNALIDMPFMVFVEFLEQWRYFLKEEKEKIH